MDKQRSFRKTLDDIDSRVLNLLERETELTLHEIANKTGEKPQAIAKSLLRLFLNNKKLLNERLLQIYL